MKVHITFRAFTPAMKRQEPFAAHRFTREQLAADPAVMAIVNTNSPMQLDIPMTEAVVELATSGQAICITPFTLAGSMSPATLAGTLAQQTAEVLAVMTLAQIVCRTLSSNRDIGAERLIAAIATLRLSRIGAAMQYEPSSFSPTSIE